VHLPDNTNIQLDILFGIVGLCVGSFLNVLALRTLSGQSVFSPPSRCPKCNHPLGWLEMIPVISYFLLKGKCAHCRASIAWHYPLVEAVTGLSYFAIVQVFGITWYGFGILFFVSVLIAVCITDFKEKLIPHEITYPAILLGIVFSAAVRKDLWGTLAGIGISYILFDFLAFYGLKIYLWIHTPRLFFARRRLSSLAPEGEASKALAKRVPRPLTSSLSLEQQLWLNEPAEKQTTAERSVFMSKGQPLDEIEVIGGGDAVLSALISSWLGFNRLVFALMLGFLVGTLLGIVYLLYDMYKHRMLKSLVRPVASGVAAMLAITSIFLALMAHITQQPLASMPWAPFLSGASVCGALFGTISVSHHVSKPFPFGPALAIGAAIAIFYDPLSGFGQPGIR
jgi:prepilin signal peptidase PulO-like enzyme (type II secretory pathway)